MEDWKEHWLYILLLVLCLSTAIYCLCTICLFLYIVNSKFCFDVECYQKETMPCCPREKVSGCCALPAASCCPKRSEICLPGAPDEPSVRWDMKSEYGPPVPSRLPSCDRLARGVFQD
ncbi:hypothetical protein M8J76_002911 [Diaphorina citri]|nr:hypothetical protein M8J75_001930 [Diaphorina citri]KAI5740344.1 hypothetical protein M8J76_002911 [Diaphorina citri]